MSLGILPRGEDGSGRTRGPGHTALSPPERLCADLKLDRGGQIGWKSDRMKEGCGAEHSREEPEEMRAERGSNKEAGGKRREVVLSGGFDDGFAPSLNNTHFKYLLE